MAKKLSDEIQNEAVRVAKAHQKQGQTKEQTKLIAQGIEKGISEYKKQQKIKSRDRDKQRKQKVKESGYKDNNLMNNDTSIEQAPSLLGNPRLLWLLLVLSWFGFIGYLLK